jgi:CRP-like cAMP-binding protein
MRAENLLLAALPQEERRRLDPFLKPVELEFGEVLIEANEPIEKLYFPFDMVTSTIQEMSDGAAVETGLMGIEGLIGVQLWLRVPTTPTRTLVQISGRALLMSADDFVEQVLNKPYSPLNDLIARYTHAFLALTSMTAACNRLHMIDARLCRWLTMVYERKRQPEFPIRQEFMALMLGVHRPTVSTAANMLQKAGLISYSRGRMRILDPEGLKEGACECLELMEAQFDRIFDRPWRELAEQADEEAGRR